MATGEAKLEAIVRQAIAAFQPKIAVRLWTGERIGPADGPVLTLHDPAAIARLAIRPTIATAVELWMAKAVDIEGGTIFDIAAARSDIRTRDALKKLDKLRIAAALPALYALARKGTKDAKAAPQAGDGA
ncbi:MAG TPA: SAM-dependent methyltransferase, partial [Aurantimonas sp.]